MSNKHIEPAWEQLTYRLIERVLNEFKNGASYSISINRITNGIASYIKFAEEVAYQKGLLAGAEEEREMVVKSNNQK